MSADIPQLILVGVIVILTVVLVILGVQIFFILKESKETLKRVNKILDGASGIVGNAAIFNNPLVKVLVGTALAFLAGKKRIEGIGNKKEIKEQKSAPKEQNPRRFFRRSL